MISAYLSENSLKAGEYLEKHKTEINAEKLPQLMAMCKDNELNYKARSTAIGLIKLPREQAYEIINNIPDPQERMATEREYNNFLRQQKTIQDEKDAQIGNSIMLEVYNEYQKGTPVSQIMSMVNRSDLSMEAKKNILSNIKDIQDLEGYQNCWVDYNSLKDMAFEDHEKFSHVNLSQYRLSKEQYMELSQMQRNAANIQYSTEAELNKVVNKMDTFFFPNSGLKSDEYQKDIIRMLSELEMKQGEAFDIKHLDQGQLDSLIKGFNYKDKTQPNANIDETKELYMRAKQRGDIRSYVTTEYQSFRLREKREPNSQEIYEIVKKGYNYYQTNQQYERKQKVDQQTILNNKINMVTPKSGETKVLTYFADTQVPAIGRALGLKLTMVDGARYRAGDNGGHGKGICCDISMSEHTPQNRKRITREIAALPDGLKIGTSDPELLRYFKGNNKIKDLTDYDRLHGTNHKNHLHIVLDSRYGGTQQGVSVSQYKQAAQNYKSPVKSSSANYGSYGNYNKPKTQTTNKGNYGSYTNNNQQTKLAKSYGNYGSYTNTSNKKINLK